MIRVKSGCAITNVVKENIPDLTVLAMQFFEESNFDGLTFSPSRFTDKHLRAVDREDDYLIGAWDMDTHEMVGFIEFSRARDYTEEWVAYLFLFYVAPSHRKTGLGRELLAEAVRQCDRDNVSRFYVSSTAGLGRDTTLKNLYRKQNFQELGCFMYRDRPGLRQEDAA